MIDPLDIGPEGAQQARDVADRSDRSMIRLRVVALTGIVGVGLVLMSVNAAVQALWMLPSIPLLFNADFKLGGTAEAYRAVAAKHEDGVWSVASVNDILRRNYRHEFYGLMALAIVVVAVRG